MPLSRTLILPPGAFLGKLPVLLLDTQELPSCPLERGHLYDCLSPSIGTRWERAAAAVFCHLGSLCFATRPEFSQL